jgi:hypothetical protein
MEILSNSGWYALVHEDNSAGKPPGLKEKTSAKFK